MACTQGFARQALLPDSLDSGFRLHLLILLLLLLHTTQSSLASTLSSLPQVLICSTTSVKITGCKLKIQFIIPLSVEAFHIKGRQMSWNERDQRTQTGGAYYDNWIKLILTQISIGLRFWLKPSEQWSHSLKTFFPPNLIKIFFSGVATFVWSFAQWHAGCKKSVSTCYDSHQFASGWTQWHAPWKD